LRNFCPFVEFRLFFEPQTAAGIKNIEQECFGGHAAAHGIFASSPPLRFVPALTRACGENNCALFRRDANLNS
jgi:hypothetical protein